MNENEYGNSHRIKLLLIDDEEAYVGILSKRLSRRDFDVTTVCSGTAGIQAVRKEEFDVVVLDLKMEDMDGIEVLKIFKRMAPSMEVIILTGHGSDQAPLEGMRLGAFDYLLKPCELDELVQKIRRAAGHGETQTG